MFHLGPSMRPKATLEQYINLRLALLGARPIGGITNAGLPAIATALLSRHRETARLLADHLCPADARVQQFLEAYLETCAPVSRLPEQTFVLDSPELAKALSLPPRRDEFFSDIVRSYRVRQGVLHNPRHDRRTTQGVFHVTEGGIAVPADKVAVPKPAFAKLLSLALRPPLELRRLPFTAGQDEETYCWVSLLLRPVVCPAVPGFIEEKSMEIRFFAPGALVSNLDFVERIFGNAGDPFLPENDAGLDVDHWTGHTGCVILAPHLVSATKTSLGLPHYDEATDRQRRDGMCWKEEEELYNGGSAFKVTCRDRRGVMVTIIADNYYGYCKKEVKTQISYSANLFGLCEEEHAGGAIAYQSYDLGEEWSGERHVRAKGFKLEEVLAAYGDTLAAKPEGYAVDRNHKSIIYIPETAEIDLSKEVVRWPSAGGEQTIKLLATKTYVHPSGYRVRMEKPPGNRAWRLVGTVAEGILCHKPSTVSGGGKSEISKPISDAIIQGSVFVGDFDQDMDRVDALLMRDYSRRFQDPSRNGKDFRPILSPDRTLGSVIKLLTPSPDDYEDGYNEWLVEIPQHIKELVFVVKRFYKLEWGERWREHFSVDLINGRPANELKCDGRKLVSNNLRVGYAGDGSWRVFGLRKDFHPAEKMQVEDDITASVVVPSGRLRGSMRPSSAASFKFVKNCEQRLFQRPDDAIHRGYDRLTELEFSQVDNFFSNYAPLTTADAVDLKEEAIGFATFTYPMRKLIRAAAKGGKPAYFVSSAHPRLVAGQPSKNPRYLQLRPDLLQPRETYLHEVCTRFRRRAPANEPILKPVDAVLPGRRNNPPEPAARLRPLAVFNPIHFLELPELFLEMACSLTGKSPSTTGAGTEGALTKGPFNALPQILDLNSALVAFLFTGQEAFLSAAGFVGPKVRVDHDLSLLIPEIWCRMTPDERTSAYLIREGHLERCRDFVHDGRRVLASRLGYRITPSFVRMFFGRVFNHPHVVFTDEMLRPETQDLDVFADGMDNIVSAHRRVAQGYFDDGTIEMACPPLRVLLTIMLHGDFEGKDLNHPEVRSLFTRESLLASRWYADRLQAQQENDVGLWKRHVKYLEEFLAKPNYDDETRRLGIGERLLLARRKLEEAGSAGYLEGLRGTIGAHPWR